MAGNNKALRLLIGGRYRLKTQRLSGLAKIGFEGSHVPPKRCFHHQMAPPQQKTTVGVKVCV